MYVFYLCTYLYAVLTVRFNSTLYIVEEDVGIVQPLLVLSNPSSFVETVEITTMMRSIIFISLFGIGAIEDVDYISGPYNVTFPIGSTSASVDIIINADNIVENNEEFLVNIFSITNNHTIDDPRQVVVTILDTTGMYIR